MAVQVIQYSDLENAFDRPERIGRVAGVIRSLRDDQTLVVGTGDDIAPGVRSLLTEGRHALTFYESVRPDLATVGNHDFDYGPEALREIVTASPQTWIASNLYQRNGSPKSQVVDDTNRFGAAVGIERTVLREIGGVRLGFLGLIDPATPGDTPTADGLVVTDPIEEARKAIASLRARGAEHVLALAHLGSDLDRLARETDSDAILAGHVHAPRIDRIEGTLITRPGANGRSVIELALEAGSWSAERQDVEAGPVEDAVSDAFRDPPGGSHYDEVVVTLSTTIPRDDEVVYGGPCRVGSTIAESYRWWTGADLGLQNSGGIRSGPDLSGSVSAAELVSLVPFQEPVAVYELAGKDLESVLEERFGRAIPGAPDDRYMGHVSGGTEDTAGELLGGTPIEPHRTYRLATSEYLGHAESEFPTLTGLEPASVSDLPQYEVLHEYVRANGFPEIESQILSRSIAGTD